ncbi:hypothetical protein NDU88_007747, partial [Pleurodeles waltl]
VSLLRLLSCEVCAGRGVSLLRMLSCSCLEHLHLNQQPQGPPDLGPRIWRKSRIYGPGCVFSV